MPRDVPVVDKAAGKVQAGPLAGWDLIRGGGGPLKFGVDLTHSILSCSRLAGTNAFQGLLGIRDPAKRFLEHPGPSWGLC